MIEGATLESQRQGISKIGWFLVLMVLVMGGFFYDQMINGGAVWVSFSALGANLMGSDGA